jgi:hypothetical protein
MEDATPETQAVVLCRALVEHEFIARQGKRRNANVVRVDHAKSEDRGRITAIAKAYTKGFDVDIRLIQTYWVITVHVLAKRAVHPDVNPIDHLNVYDS